MGENIVDGWEMARNMGYDILLHSKTGAAFGMCRLGCFIFGYTNVILNQTQVKELKRLIRQRRTKCAYVYLVSIDAETKQGE